MEHFEYVKDLVGIDHVAFGPDTLYGDHVGLHRVYSAALSIEASHKGDDDNPERRTPGFEHVEYVLGVENATEASKDILRWLVKHHYREEDIAKVLGGNVLRVLGEVW